MSPRLKLYISLAITSLIILVSFSIIFFGVYQVYFAPASLFSHDFDHDGKVEEYFEERIVNVVVLGLHNRVEGDMSGEVYFGDVYHVDTILVASVNFDQNSLTLLAIPRDSYVRIAHSGVTDRIRQSYSYGYEQDGEKKHEGGIRYTIDTVSNLLEDIELHYYIAMDIEGLKQVIDSLGGVYYTVEEPMIGFTPQESLDAGPQMLDGQGYLTYLTYREPDSRDDINRMQRQKALLMATFKYFQEMGIFNYVIPTYSAYRDHVDTDLSFNQVAALTLFAAERLEADAIQDYSLQGEYFTLDQGQTYYLSINEHNKTELLEKVTGGRGR